MDMDTQRLGESVNAKLQLSTLRKLLPFLQPYRVRIGCALVVLLIAAGAALAMPLAVRKLVDSGFFVEKPETIPTYFAVLLALVLVMAIFSATRFYLVMWLGERIVADLRRKVYARMMWMDPHFFEVTRTGEVLSRLTTDTTLIQSVVGSGVSIALRSSVMLIGSLIMLVLTSMSLTGWVLVLVPTVIIPLLVFGRRVRRLSRATQDQVAESSAIAGEVLNAIQMVQAFTLERRQIQRFSDAVEASFSVASARIRARALLSAFAITVVLSSIMVVMWVGTQQVISGELSGGELSQFLLYAFIVATSAAGLSEVWGDVQRAAGALERLMELLHAMPTILASSDPKPLSKNDRHGIDFSNVSFHYPSRPQSNALKNFSMSIAAGETVALVGASGAGKSTVFQLLLRFYHPQSGIIRLGGNDIAQADPQAVRSAIAIVPQDTVIFAASALENIRYGRPSATDEEVKEAAEAAIADSFIERQPNAYDCFLGERGVRLSGGQRQRIAIARAILKNAPVLLLDEATSSLDAENERMVQDALEHLMADRTTVVIAHRLSTVLKVDRIIVMDHGNVVATGTHGALIKQGGLYARLAELQFGSV